MRGETNAWRKPEQAQSRLYFFHPFFFCDQMFEGNALHVDGTAISLDDALHENCFVSHAHSDHTAAFGKRRKIMASDETFIIMGRAPESLSFPSVKLTPAGHMLGARQLIAETDGGKFVYTGDFALHDSYTSPAAKIEQCDTLMIDTTYALPHLNLPPRAAVLEKMRKFVSGNDRSIIVFGAYIRGKTQELVRFLNIECGVAPVVSRPAAEICARYEKCGLALDYITAGSDEAEEQMHSPFIAIMPSSMVNFDFGSKLASAFGHEVKTAVATGWAAISRFPVDSAFPLSDHADFRQTMRYVYESGAKKVICANASEEEAASYFCKLGIAAVPKHDSGREVQTTLAKAVE